MANHLKVHQINLQKIKCHETFIPQDLNYLYRKNENGILYFFQTETLNKLIGNTAAKDSFSLLSILKSDAIKNFVKTEILIFLKA